MAGCWKFGFGITEINNIKIYKNRIIIIPWTKYIKIENLEL